MTKRGILLLTALALFFSAAPLLRADIIASQADDSTLASAPNFGDSEFPFYAGIDYMYSLGSGFSGTLNSLKLRFNSGANGNTWSVNFFCRLGSDWGASGNCGSAFGGDSGITMDGGTASASEGTTDYTATWSGGNTFESDKSYFFRLRIFQTADFSTSSTLSGSSNSASYSGECYAADGQSTDGVCATLPDPYFELNATPLDVTPPNIAITSGPAEGAYASTTSVSFDFSSDDLTATYTCSLDGAATSTCTSPAAYSGLSEGAHFFTLTATDTSSNSASTTRNFIVDTTAPTVTIDAGPADGSATSSTSVSFTLSASESATFFCAFDGVATSTCGATAATSSLLDGSHFFSVYAVDQAGNTTTTLTTTFSVDTVAPVLTVSDLASPAATSTPFFTFSSDDAGAVYTCSWDGTAASSCTSPTSTPLMDGAHTFAVTATDAVGNATTTTRSFWLDTTAPTLAEVAAIATSTDTTPDYSFTTNEAGSLTFGGDCTAAATTAATGTQSVTFSALSVGTHSNCTFTVTDLAGNASTTAITAFEISAPPPPPNPGNGGGNGNVGNGPPVANPSQGLPQGIVLGVETNAVQRASETAKSIIEMILPPAKVTAPSTPKQETSEPAEDKKEPKVSKAPEPVVTPWDKPIGAQHTLAAAAATSGLEVPPWLWIAGVLVLLVIVLAVYSLRPRA